MSDRNSYNRVILVGHLGKDPEVRYIPQSNQAVAKFSLATTEVWQSQSGEKKERTDWHTIEVIGKTAEFCEKYLKKGKMVMVEGKLRYDQWTDKDGQKKTFTKVAASSTAVLGKRDDTQGGGYGGGYGSSNRGGGGEEALPDPTAFDGGDDDGELPF